MNRYEPNSLSLTTAKIKCVLSFFGTVILGRVYGRNVAKRAFLNDVTQIKTFFDPPLSSIAPCLMHSCLNMPMTSFMGPREIHQC